MDQALKEEVELRLQEIRKDPKRLMRYDANGDGVIDDEEWAEVRRVVSAEVQTEVRRQQKKQAPTPEPAELPVLQDRYALTRQIGEGGQGQTYLAVDRKTKQSVAVKELNLGRTNDWKSVDLFEREARVLESLSHPAIPAYVDAFHLQEPDAKVERFFLVQEFVDGENLETLIEQGLRFNEESAREFLEEMLQILSYLHGLSPAVIHRDIKPSNIIRRPDGRLALIDFGAVQAVLPGEKGASTIVGTSGYMPLEQLMGRATPATDIYGLGATVVHLLTHRHPADLPVKAMALQFQDFVNVSSELTGVLEGMLAPHVEDRLATAEAVRERLRPPAKLQRPAATGIAFGRPEGQEAGFLGSLVQDATQKALARQFPDIDRPVRRPRFLRSQFECTEEALMIEIPRAGVGYNLPPVLILGSFFVLGWLAMLTGEAFALGVICVGLSSLGAIMFYPQMMQEIQVRVRDGELNFVRRLPHRNKEIVLPLHNIQAVRVHRSTSTNSNSSRNSNIELIAAGKTYTFGDTLTLAEQRFLAHELKKAVVEKVVKKTE